jgi:hypothetical protein
VRDAATGRRCEQTSSAYVLTPSACDPQSAGPVQVHLKKKAAHEKAQVAPEARQAAMETLAAIAAKRMRALGLA